jgi:hypothetical protein
VLLMSKLLLNCFYATFKQWLQLFLVHVSMTTTLSLVTHFGVTSAQVRGRSKKIETSNTRLQTLMKLVIAKFKCFWN